MKEEYVVSVYVEISIRDKAFLIKGKFKYYNDAYSFAREYVEKGYFVTIYKNEK